MRTHAFIFPATSLWTCCLFLLLTKRSGSELQCLLKTSLQSRWHYQDTTALSSRTTLSLSPWSFFHGLSFTPLALPLSFTVVILSPHKPHHALSICVTSLLLLSCVCLVLSLCSQCVAVASTVVAVSWYSVFSSDTFTFVMISVCV